MTDTRLDAELRREVYRQRFASYLVNEYIKPTAQELSRSIPRILSDYDFPDVSRREVNQVNAAIRQVFNERWSGMWESVRDELRELGIHEAEALQELYSDLSGKDVTKPADEVLIGAMNAAAMTLVSGERVDAGVWDKFIRKNNTATYNLIDGVIRIGQQEGMTNQEITREIRGSYNRSTGSYQGGILQGRATQWAETLARTGVSHYANTARERTIQANSDIIDRRILVATLDNRTTILCFEGGQDYKCLGGLKKVYRSEYTGEMVIIETAGGKKLVGTPNHPILTSDGWLAMNEIDPSKHILYSPFLEHTNLPSVENVGMPTTLSELFDSVNKPSVSDVFRESSSTEDFYGDGMGGDSYVDVVSIKSHLRSCFNSLRSNKFIYKAFSLVKPASSFSRLRLFYHLLISWRPVAKPPQLCTGIFYLLVKKAFGSTKLPAYISGAHTFVKKLYCLIPVLFNKRVSLASSELWHDSRVPEYARNCTRTGFVVPSDTTGGLPIPVSCDYVLSKRSKFVDSSHVFSLESDSGIYTAGSIIVKNCRSRHLQEWPVDDDNYPRLPFHFNERSVYLFLFPGEESLDGTVPAIGGKATSAKDYRERPRYRGRRDSGIYDVEQVSANVSQSEWLKRQPRAFVKSALGDTRAKLFLDGKLDIDSFVDMQGRPLTLKELRQTTAGERAFRRAGLTGE